MTSVRRKRASSSGTDRETKVRKWLEDDGWVVGSRRHIPGPGDLLAVHPHRTFPPWLIEVKSTARSPWHAFPPEERRAMLDYCYDHELTPIVAWWPPRRDLTLIAGDGWPRS